MRSFSPWALLPLGFSIGTATGLWAVYFTALYNNIVVPLGSHSRNESLYPPFISVTGNFPPGSCYFSMVMNLAAFAGLVIGFLRYLQLKNRLARAWLNIAGLVLFSASCFGMTIVGNFQLFILTRIHDSGTLLTFGMGLLYCWLQAGITLRVNLKGEGKKVGALRFLLSGLITLCLALKYIFIMFSLPRAAQCQWALVMFFLIYVGTFAIDFRHSHFDAVCTDQPEPPEDSGTSMLEQELQRL
ncbi:transmembrane protein 150C [Oryzias melastigma]|uniref:Transmembrane protein 150C n=1 Tax=Oryzias melastigma TaxID=30732 RepID=A0A3B3CG89_ORYME|nr:transmembrane protein 150C [Oryzias melastigma]